MLSPASFCAPAPAAPLALFRFELEPFSYTVSRLLAGTFIPVLVLLLENASFHDEAGAGGILPFVATSDGGIGR